MDPQQSSCCGHHFCYKCVHKLPTHSCPLCKERGVQFFKDINFGRKLRETEVYCVNQEAGCLWEGKLGSLKHHLSIDTPEGECKHQLIKCLNFGCNDKVRRSALKIHVSQCQHRLISCKHCGITAEYNKHNPCPMMEVQCPNIGSGCEAKIIPLKLFDHLVECEFREVDCPIVGCDAHMLKKDLSSHMGTCIIDHQLIINRRMKELEQKPTVELQHAKESVIKKLDDKMALLSEELSDKLSDMQSKVERLKGEQLKLSHSIDNAKSTEYFINGLMEIAGKVRKENWRLYLHTVAEFCTQVSPVQPVIVSLQNYSTKLELSLKPGGLSFRTAQFYSSRGYRMFLNINPSSQGSHRGKYLAVFVTITKGDRDDQLVWPYEGQISIKLLNQLYDRDHHIYPKEYFLSRSNPNVRDQCIMKPATGSNQGWGYTDFILSGNLKKSESMPHIQYLVNDSLYFEVNAD